MSTVASARHRVPLRQRIAARIRWLAFGLGVMVLTMAGWVLLVILALFAYRLFLLLGPPH